MLMTEMGSVSASKSFSSVTAINKLIQPEKQISEFYMGLALAISSSIFIGTSFIFKKKGLLRLTGKSVRAGDGGYGYLRDCLWWTGMSMMAIGEVANFVAYTLAPASMVTPLGALSVLVTALLSPRCLGERVNLPGKLGCLLCITGSTVVVIHAPKEQMITSSELLIEKMVAPVYVTYASVVITFALFSIFYLAPRYGHTNPLVYIFITGSIGSLTVMNCKALGVIVKDCLSPTPPPSSLSIPLGIGVSAAIIVCLVVQINYLNRALDVYNINLVTPMLYVCFSLFVIIASAVLFREWRNQSVEDVLGNVAGLVTIVTGIFLLHAFKDMHISLASLNIRVRRDIDNNTGINGNGVAKLPS